MDENGVLYFKSRSKEIISINNIKRYFVTPASIESVLTMHPNVSECIVFGIIINDYGDQELCAWIKLKNYSKVTINDIREFCKTKLIEPKIPKYIKFVSKFPVNAFGKYMRSEMERMFKLELQI
jgi:acyl-coenzyme A synthetase/AMP-(fatty) acid ligase